QLYGQYSTESLRAALERFREAIAIDPNYALAWAGVADCLGQLMVKLPTDQRGDMAREGLEAAQRAVVLNPKLAEAHKAEALVRLYAGDIQGHRAALARALEVNPRFTPAIINIGVDRFNSGDVAGAERMMRRAIEVEPQGGFPVVWLASMMM